MGTATNPLRRLFQPLVGRTDADIDGDSVSSSAGSEGYGPLGASADGHRHAAAAPAAAADVPQDAEFVSSTPYVAPDAANPINKEAFSPNYFRTFFVEERELGRGGKGVVLLVRHEIDGCQLGYFACKRVPVGDDHAWLEKVLVEVELLAKLSHPNLVSYRHVWLENVTLNRFGPRVACAFILQQYCNGGDLHRYIIGDQPKEATKEELKARRRRLSKGQTEPRPSDLYPSPTYRHLSFDEIYSLFKDITSGLAYLHAANYIHRDLKPSNCLLHREGRILTCLISDFGEVQAENVARKSTGTTGTISYCAPEVLRKDPVTGLYGNFTTKSDVFSLGMILYFMCFGRLPYRSANAMNEELEDVAELRAEISHWKGFQYERRERPDLPVKLYQLLMRLLAVNPAERPSASEVLLAMRTDSNGLDSAGGVGGIARSGSGSGAGLAPVAATVGITGRRIQSLDSPMLSSSPVPDPSKPSNARDAEHHPPLPRFEDLDEAAVDDSDEPQSPFSRSPVALRNPFAEPTHRPSTSLTLTRSRGSQDGHSHSHSRSQSQSQSQSQGQSQSQSQSPSRSSERRTHPMNLRGGGGSSATDPVGGDASTAVMPALPASPVLSPRRRSKPQYQLGNNDDVGQQQGTEQNELPPMPTATTPLVASAVNAPVVPTYLLMPPPTTRWGEVRHRTIVFMYRHAESLAFVLRTALFLAKMASLSRPCWPYTVRVGVGSFLLLLAALDLGMPQTMGYWDWWASLVLLVVHFAVLGLAARSEVLCTMTGDEPWLAWDGSQILISHSSAD